MPKSSGSARTISLKLGLPFASIEELVAVNASTVLLSFCCAIAVEAEPNHVAKTSVAMNVHESLMALSFLRIFVLLEVRPLLGQTLLPRGDHKPRSLLQTVAGTPANVASASTARVASAEMTCLASIQKKEQPRN